MHQEPFPLFPAQLGLVFVLPRPTLQDSFLPFLSVTLPSMGHIMVRLCPRAIDLSHGSTVCLPIANESHIQFLPGKEKEHCQGNKFYLQNAHLG